MKDQSETPKVKRKRRIPPMDFSDCEDVSSDNMLKFLLGIETDEWRFVGNKAGVYDGIKVSHFLLEYCGEVPFCPLCGQKMAVHDHK